MKRKYYLGFLCVLTVLHLCQVQLNSQELPPILPPAAPPALPPIIPNENNNGTATEDCSCDEVTLNCVSEQEMQYRCGVGVACACSNMQCANGDPCSIWLPSEDCDRLDLETTDNPVPVSDLDLSWNDVGGSGSGEGADMAHSYCALTHEMTHITDPSCGGVDCREALAWANTLDCEHEVSDDVCGEDDENCAQLCESAAESAAVSNAFAETCSIVVTEERELLEEDEEGCIEECISETDQSFLPVECDQYFSSRASSVSEETSGNSLEEIVQLACEAACQAPQRNRPEPASSGSERSTPPLPIPVDSNGDPLYGPGGEPMTPEEYRDYRSSLSEESSSDSSSSSSSSPEPTYMPD